MEAIDIILLVVVVVGGIMGFSKGIVAQLGSIAALIAGVIAARLLGPTVVDFISDGSSIFGTVAGYGLAFAVAYLAVFAIARLLKLTIHTLCLGIVDRLAGAAFKILEWGLVLSLALNVYLLAIGDDAELCNPSKPWRKVAVDLAPTTLGYLTNLHNNQAMPGVDTSKHCENEGE